MDWKEIISNKEFAFHRVSALVILLIGSSIGMMAVVIPFIENYIEKSWVHLVLLGFIEVSIVMCWYYYRTVFPKGEKNKQNIILSITTENERQKARVKKDLAQAIETRLKHFGLNKHYSILVLHNHLSEEAKKILEEYTYLKAQQEDVRFAKLKLDKLSKRLKGVFYIYGDLVLRNSPNSKYCLRIGGLMLHKKTSDEGNKVITEDFKALWKSHITFLEDEELTGFEENADHLFFTATYMLGLATFTDNNFEQGIRIWDKLIQYINRYSQFSGYERRVVQLKSTAHRLYGALLYNLGEIEKAIEQRDIYLDITPDKLGTYLNESIRAIRIEGDPEAALRFVEEARKVSGKDGTWRYNKFYVLLYTENFIEALTVLDEILNYSYEYEDDVVRQVISYNEVSIREGRAPWLSYFILGVIEFKKRNNPPISLEYFEKFKEQIEDNSDQKAPIMKRVEIYIEEIEGIIGL